MPWANQPQLWRLEGGRNTVGFSWPLRLHSALLVGLTITTCVLSAPLKCQVDLFMRALLAYTDSTKIHPSALIPALQHSTALGLPARASTFTQSRKQAMPGGLWFAKSLVGHFGSNDTTVSYLARRLTQPPFGNNVAFIGLHMNPCAPLPHPRF